MFSRLKFPIYLIPVFAVLIAVAISMFFAAPAHALFCSPGQYATGSFFISCNYAQPGFYAPGDDHQYPCPVGYYTPGSGYSSCLTAPAGTYVSSTGSSSFTPCPAGTFNPSPGATSSAACILTPAGYYSFSGAASPTPCTFGTFNPSPGATSSAACQPAPPGTYVNTTAATAPTPCAAGTYTTSFGSTSCIPSPAGHFVPVQGWGGPPPACAVGSYQPAIGKTSCILADPGYYVSVQGATAQTACALGTYQPLSGQGGCNAASPGNYVDSLGSVAQIACALGTYQPLSGQSSCLVADPGYYVDTVGATSQTACPAGTTSDAGASSCTPLDSTAPTITITTPADGANYLLGQSVNADYFCADEDGGSGLASCVGTVDNGSAIDTNSLGAHTFTVDASDNAGNPASLTYTYNVIYNFSGFLAPVNGDVVNQVKAGQGVPVKFSLSGDFGLAVFTSGYPKFEFTACSPGDPVDPVEETVSAGNSGLSYDAATGLYTYVWKTDKKWANKCGMLTLKFTDNSQYSVDFKFTK